MSTTVTSDAPEVFPFVDANLSIDLHSGTVRDNDGGIVGYVEDVKCDVERDLADLHGQGNGATGQVVVATRVFVDLKLQMCLGKSLMIPEKGKEASGAKVPEEEKIPEADVDLDPEFS